MLVTVEYRVGPARVEARHRELCGGPSGMTARQAEATETSQEATR